MNLLPLDGENRLLKVPLELRIKAENLLYEIGKTIFDVYNCFKEMLLFIHMGVPNMILFNTIRCQKS